jgi:FkbM family methyltransferase
MDRVALTRRIVGRVLRHAGADRALVKWRAWEDKRFGEPEIRLLKYLVDSRRTAIDIGAAEGVYAFYLQRMARRCVAFEPNPDSYAYLQRALTGVELHHAAVSAADGEATLRVPVVKGVAYAGWGTIESKNQLVELPAHGLREIKVRTVRPDQMALGDVGFVKIDVEGHELDVLTGLSGLLERCLPNLLIEIGGPERGGSLSEVRRRLDPLGYVCLRLNEQGLLSAPADHAEPATAMNVIFIANQEAAVDYAR